MLDSRIVGSVVIENLFSHTDFTNGNEDEDRTHILNYKKATKTSCYETRNS